MAVFQFKAMNQAGQEVKDEIEADSTEEALAKIRKQGFFVTSVKEKAGKKKPAKAKTNAPAKGKKKPAASGGIGGIKLKLITQFTRQLSTLQDAGLPILRSIRILEQQQKPGVMRLVLRETADDIEGGMTLSESLARHPKAFDRLFTNMVAAGEAGGVLDVILQRLADFMESAQRLKRQVVGAMIYPIVVVGFATFIVTGIMVFVVPRFQEIFKDFGTELPGMTMILLNISYWFVGKYDTGGGRMEETFPGWVLVVFSPLILFSSMKLLKQSQAGRYVMDFVLLKIPILGTIMGRTAVARFTRTLGTLINAGVPILEAITITKETSGNEVYRRALGSIHDAIREGESFASPLRASKVVDGIVVNMVDVGEETGDLDRMLLKVADNYDEEVEVLVGGLVSMLEPIMVVVLGGIVMFIVLALFLPLVTLINSVSGG